MKCVRKKGFRAWLSLPIMAVLLSACATVSTAPPTQPGTDSKPLEKVVVGTVKSITDSGMLIANARGYFKEQGLEVEMVTGKSVAELLPAIATGEMDAAGFAVSANVLNAVLRGVDIRLVVDKGSGNLPFSAALLLVRKDLYEDGTIREAADFKGRTIALGAPNSLPEFAWAQALKPAGLTIDDVNVVNMSYADMIVAFANKSIDAAHILEPFGTRAISQGSAVVWKTLEEVLPSGTTSQSAMLAYSPKFATNGDKPVRFMVAYLKGIRDYHDAFANNKDREAVIQNLMEQTTVKERALYDSMHMPYLNPNGYISVPDVIAASEYFVQRGYAEKMVDMDQLIDHQFVDKALDILGKR